MPRSSQLHEPLAPETAQQWREAVLDQERRGELLAAFDLAERAIERHPADLWLKHRAVLMLARAGATEEAARRFEDYSLGAVEDEDVAALRARIAKDRALAADPGSRRALAADAAELYAAIFARTGGYYPAVNAATLKLVAGDARGSRATARTVVAALAKLREDSYYAAASEGEARLLLGEEQAAADALRRAAERHGDDFGALATTRRQLRLVCELTGVDEQLLAVLAGPAVVHFCGHRMAADTGGPFAAGDEPAVRALIEREVLRQRAGYAYGSLASGADILWAEALRRAGGELHVVLPFEREEFLERSVAPAGTGWVRRFEACLGAASSVRYATDGAFLGDDVLFRYCSELAMGLALLRARYLDADVRQLAVWDGEPARGAAGTSLDLATWRRAGHSVTVLDPGGAGVNELGPGAPQELQHDLRHLDGPVGHGSTHRVVRAMLFGDIKGFSKLSDEQLPRFQSLVLGLFAEVLARHREHVWHRNTWGDAIYAVLTDAPRAAACAIDLQEALSALDLAAAGLPSELAMRLSGHVGPVFMTRDPVLDDVAFIGSHVSRTARIEPVTPPAAVYVTEPFAAALALEAEQDFACDYVGHMPAAKDYGRLRMYRLRRAHSEDAPARAGRGPR